MKSYSSLLGQIYSFSLKNHLQCFLIPRKNCNIAEFQIWVKSGSVHETPWLGYGLSHFLEHMVFQGSLHHNHQQINRLSSQWGAFFNAATSFDYTKFYCSSHASHFLQSLRLLSEMIQEPAFNQTRFEIEKNIILREKEMHEDQLNSVIMKNFSSLFPAKHPLRYPIIGHLHKIEKVNQEITLQYYQKQYHPQNIFLIASGDFDPQKIHSIILKLWENWRLHDAPAFLPRPTLPFFSGIHQKFDHFDDHLHTGILIFPGVDLSDPRKICLEAAASLLGDSASRFEQIIQNKLQLVNSIYTFHYKFLDKTFLWIVYRTDAIKFDRATQMIKKEFIAFTRKKITQNNITQTIRNYEINYLQKLFSLSEISNFIGEFFLNHNSIQTLDNDYHQMLNLSPPQIMEAIHSLNLHNYAQISLAPTLH